MSLKKRTNTGIISPQEVLKEGYNLQPENSVSKFTDIDTNFFLRDITYEAIDKAVFDSFHNRFTITGSNLPLINLDKEAPALRYENYQQYDNLKQYLNPPFFTMYRTGIKPMWRVSPANKNLIYAKPKQGPDGLFIEEYISVPPRNEKLLYEFKFVTNYRERINDFENQMNEYFKNKANIIQFDTGERFVIKPQTSDDRGELEKMNRGTNALQFVFALTYTLEVWAYLRDSKATQKRQRPNVINFSLSEKSTNESEIVSVSTTSIKRLV